MQSWKLDQIGGSTPEVRDYCRQIYYFFTRIPDYEYFHLSPRGGKTPGTYRRFHNKIREISKRYPNDVLTLQYTFKKSENEPTEIRIIEYKKGTDRMIRTE